MRNVIPVLLAFPIFLRSCPVCRSVVFTSPPDSPDNFLWLSLATYGIFSINLAKAFSVDDNKSRFSLKLFLYDFLYYSFIFYVH